MMCGGWIVINNYFVNDESSSAITLDCVVYCIIVLYGIIVFLLCLYYCILYVVDQLSM